MLAALGPATAAESGKDLIPRVRRSPGGRASSAVPPSFLRGPVPLAASSGYDLVPGTQTAGQRPGRRQGTNSPHLIHWATRPGRGSRWGGSQSLQSSSVSGEAMGAGRPAPQGHRARRARRLKSRIRLPRQSPSPHPSGRGWRGAVPVASVIQGRRPCLSQLLLAPHGQVPLPPAQNTQLPSPSPHCHTRSTGTGRSL